MAVVRARALPHDRVSSVRKRVLKVELQLVVLEHDQHVDELSQRLQRRYLSVMVSVMVSVIVSVMVSMRSRS